MPEGVLAVYYSLVDWQGANLTSLGQNGTVTSLEPGNDDISEYKYASWELGNIMLVCSLVLSGFRQPAVLADLF